MYAEDELLPISALQHLVFCERQCALIHLEGLWADNELTVSGSDLHRRVDEVGVNDQRGDVRICRGLALHSLRLGLVGRADVVELHRTAVGDDDDAMGGVPFDGLAGRWRPFPVEYKRGRPKSGDHDRIQLCAQALCLEEMLGVEVPVGALYYGQPRRRTEVVFDTKLRTTTEGASQRLQSLVRAGTTPRVERAPKCRRCSLRGHCLPEVTAPGHSGHRYLTNALRKAQRDGDR